MLQHRPIERARALVAHVSRQWQPERRRLFPSWEAAKRAAATYGDSALTAFRAVRSIGHKANGQGILATPLNLLAIALGRENLSIIDLGGSTGELGKDFLARYPRGSYCVVETPALVESMRAARPELQFATTVSGQCDVFYTSGTLQYLDDPMSALAAGMKSARSAVVLARNSFCDTDLYRVQKSRLFDNGSGDVPPGFSDCWITYPHRTINEGAVMRMAADHGFSCAARMEETSGVYRYRGAVYGKQLVFLKS
jgi:putative methyltransferase (TIGR04325 family)